MKRPVLHPACYPANARRVTALGRTASQVVAAAGLPRGVGLWLFDLATTTRRT